MVYGKFHLRSKDKRDKRDKRDKEYKEPLNEETILCLLDKIAGYTSAMSQTIMLRGSAMKCDS